MAVTVVGERPRVDRQDFLPAAAAIFVLALGLRLLHIVAIRTAPFFSLYMGDARGYHEWGQRIAAGQWFGDTVFYQAPLYPYFLGALYTVFGEQRWLVLSLQAVLGAVSCVLLARAGWHLFSPAAGVVAGLILALYAPAIFFDGLVQKSVLDLFLLCLVLWLASRLAVATEPSPRGWAWLGAALGGLVLSRENALVLVVAILAWIWLSPALPRRRPAASGWFLLGLALVLLPIAARNRAVGGEFHLTTSQFGPNFYIGNHRHATGIYQPLRLGRGSVEFERRDATEIAQQALGRQLTPGDVSRYWTHRAIADIAAEPIAWLRLLGTKLLLAVNAVEIGDTEDQYTYADASLVLRMAGYWGHFGIIAPLAILGLWVTRDRRHRLWPLYLMLTSYLASLLIFYVFARYRYPLVPLLIPFAAAGLVELPRRVREGPRSRLATAAAVLTVAAMMCNLPLISKDRVRSMTELSIGEALSSEGHFTLALAHSRRATELDSNNALAFYNLGTMLQSRGELDAAIRGYHRTLEIRPDYAPAAVNLGVALASQGETAAAIEQFRRALRLDPHNAKARHNLDFALRSRND